MKAILQEVVTSFHKPQNYDSVQHYTNYFNVIVISENAKYAVLRMVIKLLRKQDVWHVIYLYTTINADKVKIFQAMLTSIICEMHLHLAYTALQEKTCLICASYESNEII